MTEKKDMITKDSRYRDAFMAVCLDPSSWAFTIDQTRDAVYRWLKKHHGKTANITRPGISTYYRVIRHPDFQVELKTMRSALVRRAMPAIERKLIERIVEDGDLKAYDRLKRAIGEDNINMGSIEIYGQGGEITEKDVETVLGRMADARTTRPKDDKPKTKPKMKKKKKKGK